MQLRACQLTAFFHFFRTLLARFGGLRCPSEILALEWQWVDWARDRINVFAPKQEHLPRGGKRVVPLFPELRVHLAEAFEQAEEGAVHVIVRYRDASAILRTQFERIISRAGVKQWGRLFHNLRSSRQTELTEIFPAHVVASWLGNTERIAATHYLQVTEDHMRRAAKSDAKALQNSMQQAAAGARVKSQDGLQVLADCEHVRSLAAVCTNDQYPRQESNL